VELLQFLEDDPFSLLSSVADDAHQLWAVGLHGRQYGNETGVSALRSDLLDGCATWAYQGADELVRNRDIVQGIVLRLHPTRRSRKRRLLPREPRHQTFRGKCLSD